MAERVCAKAVGKWLLVAAKTLKGLKPEDVDYDLAKSWSLVLEAEGVSQDECNFVFQEILAQETFFPTPAEVVKRVYSHRTFVVVECADGLCHGKWALPGGREAAMRELYAEFGEPDGRSALPITGAVRADAAERLDRAYAAAEGRATARLLKTARQIVEVDPKIQALPVLTPEQVEARKEELLRQALERAQ